jgi:hypothetical protein
MAYPRSPESGAERAPRPETQMPSPRVGPPKPPSNGEVAAGPAVVVNKEEIEKAPGSVIVPCRARGMPMDHNFKVRYISYVFIILSEALSC